MNVWDVVRSGPFSWKWQKKCALVRQRQEEMRFRSVAQEEMPASTRRQDEIMLVSTSQRWFQWSPSAKDDNAQPNASLAVAFSIPNKTNSPNDHLPRSLVGSFVFYVRNRCFNARSSGMRKLSFLSQAATQADTVYSCTDSTRQAECALLCGLQKAKEMLLISCECRQHERSRTSLNSSHDTRDCCFSYCHRPVAATRASTSAPAVPFFLLLP